jgi:hypothetical protein
MKTYLPLSVTSVVFFLVSFSCSPVTQQYTWKTVTFMDHQNKVFLVSLRIDDAHYDELSGYLRVDGRIKNRSREKRNFDLHN